MIRRELTTALKRSRRDAFTLMEMLVVVAIIVALAGMGGFYFMGALNDSKKDVAQTQCKTLEQACEAWSMKPGNSGVPDLNALKVGDANNPPLLKKDAKIIDPWNNPYQVHVLSTGQINVYSNGPPGGTPINKLD